MFGCLLDPMRDEYPNMSPFNYCNLNPIMLIDPDGRDIVVAGEDGVNTTYKPGMEYKGKDAFTAKSIKSLNEMNSTRNGSKVLDKLVDSKNKFNLTNNASAEGTGSFIENSNGGGTINMNGLTSLSTVSHELFHGYQHEMKQGGGSIFNEVEAYIFSQSVSNNYAMKNDLPPAPNSFSLSRTESDQGESCENSMNKLQNDKKFPKSDFINAVKLFKSQSSSNSTGTYNKTPLRGSNQKKSILSGFYPLNN